MNVKLLRKIQKHILAEPRRLDMTGWGVVNIEKEIRLRPPCGTQACIAGWAFLLGDKPKIAAGEPELVSSICADALRGTVPGRAARLLSINYLQARKLFFGHEWPHKFARTHDTARTPRGRAQATARRIDHFIKTKGAE